MLRLSLCLLLLTAFAAGQSFWERRAPYPLEATGVATASLNGRVYAACGIASFAALPQVFEYDASRNTWSTATFNPFGRADRCSMAVASGKLYLFGAVRPGSTQTDGTIYEFQPSNQQWTVVGRMISPRFGAGIATQGNNIYVVGGNVNGQAVGTVEVFDSESRTWRLLPTMPTARELLTAEIVNGRLYAVGGRLDTRVFNFVEELDLQTGLWRRVAPAPTARFGAGSGALNGRMIVFGGESEPSGGRALSEVEEFDPATGQWQTLAQMQVPRREVKGAASDGRIFAVGGAPSPGTGSFSSATEALYVIAPGGPRLSARVNAASFEPGFAPNTIATLFGTGLGFGRTAASTNPLPTRLENVELLLSGIPVPLLFISPQQINFVVPPATAVGDPLMTLQIAGTRYELGTLRVDQTAPAVFTATQTGRGQAAALVAGTGRLADVRRPARRGDALEIYLTGLNGARPTVAVGGFTATVLFSGPAPGLVGVDQVNILIPAETPTGDSVSLTVLVGGQQANAVTIAIE